MNNLLKIPKFTIIGIYIVLLLLFASLIYVSKYKVEESFQTNITVTSDNNRKIIIESKDIYKIDYDSKIILYYRKKYHEYLIDFIAKEKNNFLINIEPIYESDDKLIPGSTVNANVVYSTDTILNIILNYFK